MNSDNRSSIAKEKPRLLVILWLALLGLLLLSAFASQKNLGSWNLPISLVIAALKIGILCWFYMDLRRAPGLVRLAAAAGLIIVSLLFGLAAVDFGPRKRSAAEWQRPEVVQPTVQYGAQGEGINKSANP